VIILLHVVACFCQGLSACVKKMCLCHSDQARGLDQGFLPDCVSPSLHQGNFACVCSRRSGALTWFLQ